MDYYYTAIALLGMRDSNLPPFKEARLKRYKSIRKMIDLIDTASKLAPSIPSEAFFLNPNDPEWDDDMTYPVIQHSKYYYQMGALGLNLALYAYNYNNFTYNIRFRTFRYLFPFVNLYIFADIYWRNRVETLKVNLFDEYVQLRAKELVEQNEYLLEHEDVKKFVWWFEDFRETLMRIHRTANNHDASDFKDAELVLQDFIRRYSDPSKKMPLIFEERSAFL